MHIINTPTIEITRGPFIVTDDNKNFSDILFGGEVFIEKEKYGWTLTGELKITDGHQLISLENIKIELDLNTLSSDVVNAIMRSIIVNCRKEVVADEPVTENLVKIDLN